MAKESQDPFNRRAVSGGQYGVPHEEFKIESLQPLVKFLREGIQPPSIVYMTLDDQIQILIAEALTVKSLNVQGRWLRASDNSIVAFQFAFAPTVSGGVALFTFRLGEGFLLSLNISNPSANISESSDYAIAALSRTGGSFGQGAQTLAAGYIGANKALSFPLGGILRPLDGPGYIRSITGTTPAAGAEISETVPSGARWRFFAIRFSLTTAVAVANRNVSLQKDDGANVYDEAFPGLTQTASQTAPYTFSNNAVPTIPALSTNINVLPMDDSLIMAPGHRIRTRTFGIQAADQYTAPQYLVQQWTDLE